MYNYIRVNTATPLTCGFFQAGLWVGLGCLPGQPVHRDALQVVVSKMVNPPCSLVAKARLAGLAGHVGFLLLHLMLVSERAGSLKVVLSASFSDSRRALVTATTLAGLALELGHNGIDATASSSSPSSSPTGTLGADPSQARILTGGHYNSGRTRYAAADKTVPCAK